MEHIQMILTIGSLLTFIGGVLVVLAKVHKWYLKQEKQDESCF